MTVATEQLIQSMADIVAHEADATAVILFGSHALGTAGPDSDVDFLVVEEGPFGPARDRRLEMTRLWRALAHFAVPKDILLFSREEVERWRNSPNHVIARALREGKLLHGSL